VSRADFDDFLSMRFFASAALSWRSGTPTNKSEALNRLGSLVLVESRYFRHAGGQQEGAARTMMFGNDKRAAEMLP